MASTHFTTGTTITSEWLNDVNDAVYEGNITAEGVQYTPPFTGGVTETVEAKLAQTVSVKDFGAVGDGVTDDSAAIQAALDAVADGGNLYFPVGEYFCPYTRSDGNTLVLESQSVSGDYPASYTNQPIRLIGDGAILKADPITGDDVIFLNVVGAQNVEVTGLTFVGTRIPNDTEISVFGNTLLYFSYCQNVTVTNNKFINCNGAGVYYFVNDFIVSNNIFQTTNGGCQGNYSKNVQISNNIFKCYKKCDDQIGIFSDVSRDSANITIVGNTVDKGYDGSKGTGGTTRGWARCIIIAGANTRDVLIASNNLLNNNSTDPADRTGTSGAAIIIETDAVYRCKISANRISNCRLGIYFASKSDISITDNEFDLIENTVIQGTNAINGYVTIDNNVFNNCGTVTTSDFIVYVYNWGTGACSVSGNTFFRCTSYITMNLGSATTFQSGQLTVMNNVENQSTDVTAVSNSAFCKVGYVNRAEVLNNTSKKLCQNAIYISNRGDYAEVSGNTVLNFSVAAVDIDTIYTGLAGMVISKGNFAIASGAAYSGRDRMLKMLAGVGSLNGAGNYARYLTSDSYGQGIYYGNAGEITSTTGANFQIGDKLYYNSVTSGGYIGQTCTAAGAPGTWKTFGVIS
jgi:parallel beta-helix repeat protein